MFHTHQGRTFLLNLIDTPGRQKFPADRLAHPSLTHAGHVDFAWEVSRRKAGLTQLVTRLLTSAQQPGSVPRGFIAR